MLGSPEGYNLKRIQLLQISKFGFISKIKQIVMWNSMFQSHSVYVTDLAMMELLTDHTNKRNA